MAATTVIPRPIRPIQDRQPLEERLAKRPDLSATNKRVRLALDEAVSIVSSSRLVGDRTLHDPDNPGPFVDMVRTVFNALLDLEDR